MSGLRAYKNAESAESSLQQFRAGKTPRIAEWAAVLVDQGFRIQDKVNGQKRRADTENGFEILKETLRPDPVVEQPPEVVEAAAVTLRVDVGTLTETLARFGITLVIE